MDIQIRILYPKVFNIQGTGFVETEYGLGRADRFDERVQLGCAGKMMQEIAGWKNNNTDGKINMG